MWYTFAYRIMVHLSTKDFYEVHMQSLLSELDTQALILLYQPFIGVEAVATFLTLKQRILFQDITNYDTIESLLTLMDVNLTQFHHARLRLEGVGLLKTTRIVVGETAQYRFDLFAPKTFSTFFDDPLLSGMLRLSVGEKHVDYIQRLFQQSPIDAHAEDVSASFGEVFHPNLQDPAFNSVTKQGLLGRASSQAKRTFDLESFQHHVSQLNLPFAGLSTQWHQLVEYATLYGLDELALAEILLSDRVYNVMTGVVNYDELGRLAALEKRLPFVRQRQHAKLLDATTDRAHQINAMETLSPLDFLRSKQHGADPSSPDVKLISDLYFSQQLPHPVINALVDYVLQTQNNTLPRAYTLKLASSLSRENVKHAIDALDYFSRVTQKGQRPKKTSSPVQSDTKQETPIQEDELKALEDAMKAFK